jgi:hypothetical protein
MSIETWVLVLLTIGSSPAISTVTGYTTETRCLLAASTHALRMQERHRNLSVGNGVAYCIPGPRAEKPEKSGS